MDKLVKIITYLLKLILMGLTQEAAIRKTSRKYGISENFLKKCMKE
jgi:hypothetical protein